MMDIDSIKSAYPKQLKGFESFMLREYLQYKILEILFNSTFREKFVFLGGTCLRIVHNNQRFSEDLDFDNFNITKDDFEAVSKVIQQGLEAEGYSVELKNVYRGAYHCYIKFPSLLYETGLSGHRQAKILINLDTEPQGFNFEPEVHFLNKFGVFTSLFTTPLDLLLAQKFVAISQRKRPKGRDFYDVVFLLGKEVKPNYGFLKMRLGIENEKGLKAHLKTVCTAFDFNQLAEDVQPFLFNPNEIRKITDFPLYIPQMKLE